MCEWNLNLRHKNYSTTVLREESVIHVLFGLNENGNINQIGNFKLDLNYLLENRLIKFENDVRYRVKIYLHENEYYISRNKREIRREGNLENFRIRN